jgi:hypothetical protein
MEIGGIWDEAGIFMFKQNVSGLLVFMIVEWMFVYS